MKNTVVTHKPQSLPILMYHSLDDSGSVVSVNPKEFAKQMECLADAGFRGTSLREAVTYRNDMGYWPSQTVVLTFDDGFASVTDKAVDVLDRFGFTATVFVISGYMGRCNDWADPPAGLGTRRILSWGQARELARAGLEIGSHTRTHPDLTCLSATQAKEEIVGSRREIEDIIGDAVTSFSYPYGEMNSTVSTCVEKEFQAACTTDLRRANHDPLHYLPRVDMYYVNSEQKLRRLLKGELDQYLAFRAVGRVVRRAVMRGMTRSPVGAEA